MRILVIALLKPSQIKYKIIPLALSDKVDEIIIVRKYPAPNIEKVKYLTLPKICKYKVFNLILTPFILLFWAYKLKPDLILSYHFIPHGLFAWIVSSITGIPFIYSQIDLDVQKLIKTPIIGKFVRYAVGQALYINVPGTRSKEFWINNGLDQAKINILHSTIDTDNDYYPVDLQKEYDFIYVGVLDERKRIDLMLKAISIVKKIGYNPKLLIVGDGMSRNYLEDLSKRQEVSENITFIGHSDRIHQLLNKASFFLLTSNNEGIPCAMMEAMSCGLVPLSTDVADVSDIVIEGSTGILIKNNDISSVCDALKKALSKEIEYSKYSSNARKIIVDYHSYSSATQTWNKLLKSITNENIN